MDHDYDGRGSCVPSCRGCRIAELEKVLHGKSEALRATCDQFAELEAEVAELRKDRARLNLLESGEYEADWKYREMCGPIVYKSGTGSHRHGDTLRDALDGWLE